MALNECWDDELFSEPRSSDDPLRCGICQGIMKDAVQCPREHCFGMHCLKQALAVKRECPTCRVPLLESDIKPSRMVRSIIDRLTIKCANSENGCTEPVTLEQRDYHESKCGFALVSCPFDGCSQRVLRKDLPAHTVQCSFSSMNCSICGASVARQEISKHSCLSQLLSRLEMAEQTVQLQAEMIATTQHQLAALQTEHGQEIKLLHRKILMLEADNAARSSSTRVKKQRKPSTTHQIGSKRPTIDDIVILVDNLTLGCLVGGQAGWVVKDERDHQPFLVKTREGATYWYRESEVRFLASPDDDVTILTARLGLPVVRGPDWKWHDQDDYRHGFVSMPAGDDECCQVTWLSGSTGKYRVGARGNFDLRVARMSVYSAGDRD